MGTPKLDTAHTIVITGGAGYLARAIYTKARAEGWPARFVAISRDDAKHIRLRRHFPEVTCLRGDVASDPALLAAAFAGADIVIHAAADKYVDVSERTPIATLRTNVIGSLNVATAAAAARVKMVIGISTDKACHPENIYGASKMCMERTFMEANGWGGPRFMVCRYGNVIASTGSVVEVFRRQIRIDERVTVTDPGMTRFWMRPSEAVALIEATAREAAIHPGTLIVPRALASLRMGTVARYLWELERPKTTPVISYIGHRPGEKMHEELLTQNEYQRHLDITRDVIVVAAAGATVHGDREPASDVHTSSHTAPAMDLEEFLAGVREAEALEVAG